MLWDDTQQIATAKETSKQLLFVAWELLELSCLVHWISAVVLFPRCPIIAVGIWPTGYICIAAFFVQTCGLVGTMSFGLKQFNVAFIQYVLYVLENVQLVLVHWASAVLLTQECTVLHHELWSFATAQNDAAFKKATEKVSEAQARWRLVLLFCLLPEVAAIVLLSVGEFMSARTGTMSAAIDSGTSLAFLTLLFLVLLKPIHNYNDAVAQAQLRVTNFRMSQNLQRRPLLFRVCGIPIGTRIFKALSVSAISACLMSTFST